MGELLHGLGFTPIKFFFTIFNFLLVFFVLKKFLFGKITLLLEQRQEKIGTSVRSVEEAKKSVENAGVQANETFVQARQEAERIINLAQEEAKEIINKAKTEAEWIKIEASTKLESEKEKIRQEMSHQLIDLVSVVTSKLLSGFLSQDVQRMLIEKLVVKTLEERTPSAH